MTALSALVTLLVSAAAQLVGSAPASNDSNRLSLIWPRAVAAGATSVVWLADAGPSDDLVNVTVRLADAERTYCEKSVASRAGLVSPVELAVPRRYDGQLTVRVECADERCRRQELPVHPLDAIQSLSLRLERAVYHPDDVVSIWLACVDQRGQIIAAGRADSGGASSARRATLMTDADAVQVAVHDPNNVIVQYWSVTSCALDNLAFQLSDRPLRSGAWTVRASVGDVTAVESFRVSDAGSDDDAPSALASFEDGADSTDPSLSIESHFVELSFSPRTASAIEQGSPFAGELIAGTSERGITVGLDVLDQHGQSVHHQDIHLNRTSSATFTVPALTNLTTNATLQGTLQSIEGQPLDNQFVLATHGLTVTAPPSGSTRGPCNVQLFSLSGQYRFAEGQMLGLAVYSNCGLLGNRINYAVTSRSSGRLISWGQEHIVETLASPGGGPSTERRLIQLNLSIPIEYEMIPRAVVTVFFPRDERHLASGSLDIAVRPEASQSAIEVGQVRASRAKVNLTLKTRQRHCLYGSAASGGADDETDPLSSTSGSFAPSIEADGFLRLLPKYRNAERPWRAFGDRDLWYVRCFDTRTSSSPEFVSKELELAVPAGGGQLALLSVDEAGRVRRSAPLKLAPAAPDWTIDFQLPGTVRVGEEVVVDVAIVNRFRNCSQVQLQMALSGGAVFVSNEKKFLQQPACLAPRSRSVYRVGIIATPSNEPSKTGQASLTVQAKGVGSASCCAPASDAVVLLDARVDPVETVPVTKSMRLLPRDFQRRQIDSYLFCLEEKSFVSNASAFKYDVLPLGKHVKTVIFQASASADLRVALGESRNLNSDDDGAEGGTSLPAGSSYHIVLGGEDNAYSWISKQMNSLTEVKAKVATPRLLRPDRLQTFWISWDQAKPAGGGRKKRNNNNNNNNGSRPARKDHSAHARRPTLTLGRGSHVGARAVVSIPLERDPAFRFIGFSTGWGFHGFFRVWGTDGSADQTIRSINVPKPDGAVRNLKADLTIKGGLMSVLDDVWRPAIGDGPASTLSGVLERFYRARTSSPRNRNRPDVRDSSAVLQNVLYFRSPDGSFRNEPLDAANLRLTALAVHALSSARLQSYSDPGLLKSSLQWMHAQQNEDGSFGGGADDAGRTLVTAFVLTALADVQHDDIALYQVCSAAQRFLEAQLAAATDVKLIVPSSSAVLVSHSSLWPAALAKLDSVYDQLLECHDRRECLSEMTYALTAYFHQNKHERAFDLIRSLNGAPWETLQPTDKVRTMKAWSKYHQAVNDPVRNLDMHIAFQNGAAVAVPPSLATLNNDSSEAAVPVPLDDDDDDATAAENDTRPAVESSDEQQSVRLHTPPLTYEIPSLPQTIETAVTGAGCAVLQTGVHWSTPEPPALAHSPLAIYSGVQFSSGADKDEPPSEMAIDLCVRWNGNATSTLRARTTPFSSYVISNATLDGNPVEIEHDAWYNYISVDLGEIKSQCGRCLSLRAARKGLVRNIHPGRIEIYDAARPHEVHEFLLHGPSNATAAWADHAPVYDEVRYLASRPTICS